MIRNFLDWLFAVPPKVNSLWTIENAKNPFRSPKECVEILACRDGYVKYRYNDPYVKGTSSKTIRLFRSIYNEVPEEYYEDEE